MGTQLAAVRSALLDALADLPDFLAPGPTGQKPDVQFARLAGWTRREQVWTQKASADHQPAGMKSGTTLRKETGEFDVMIRVEGVGLSQQVTTERVMELFTAVETWVADKPNWNAPELVPGIYELQVVGEWFLAEELDEKNGGRAQVNVPIRYRARIE